MSIQAHKRTVKVVMDVLAELMSEAGIPEDDMNLAPAAINIVGSLLTENLLLVDGEIHAVANWWRNHGDDRYPGTVAYRVYVPDEFNNPNCKWCGSSYKREGIGALHSLCPSCFRCGPSD
jgi:hypothetical protein